MSEHLDKIESKNSSPIPPKVSMQTKLSYGYGSFGKDFSLALVNIFLFFYLTDVAGMSAATVGIIFLIARIWDTVNDPIWGYIVAKTNTRWGKYKPWLFIGNIFNFIFMVACFATHYFEGTTQVIYLSVVYICWGMAYTICDAPFWSLIPTITLDKGEREGLLPYPRFTATIGAYMASGLGIYAVHLFGQGDDGFGYMIYAGIGGLLAISSAWVTCKWTEQNYEESGSDDFNIKEAIFIVTHNKQFLIFLSLAFCFVIGTGIRDALNLYMFKYALNDDSLFSTMMLAASIIAIPTLIGFKAMVNAIGRKTVFILAITLPFLATALLSFASWGILPVYPMVLLSGGISGFSTAVYWLLVMIMVADTVDYGDTVFSMRSESIYYSLHTLLAKCSGAVSSAVVGFFLTMVNYVPNVEQTPETVNAIVSLYWGITFLCLIGGLIYIFAYKLNGSVLDDIQRTLTRRYMDKVVAKAVTEEVSKDLELLNKAQSQANADS